MPIVVPLPCVQLAPKEKWSKFVMSIIWMCPIAWRKQTTVTFQKNIWKRMETPFQAAAQDALQGLALEGKK